MPERDERVDPVFIPRPLKPDVLCFGIKRGGETVIFYNENRDIPDLPRETRQWPNTVVNAVTPT